MEHKTYQLATDFEHHTPETEMETKSEESKTGLELGEGGGFGTGGQAEHNQWARIERCFGKQVVVQEYAEKEGYGATGNLSR